MRTTLFLLGLAVASMASSQPPARPSPSGWSVQALGSVAMTYRNLLNKSGTPANEVTIAFRDDVERPRTCLGGQVLLMRSLGGVWAIGGGLAYARFSHESDHAVTGVSFGALFDPRRGSIYNTYDVLPTRIRYTDDLSYAGGTLRVEHSWGQRRLHAMLGASVCPMFLLDASSTGRYAYADGSSQVFTLSARSDFRPFNLLATVDAGCAFDAGERLQLRLMPCGTLGVIDVMDAPISSRPWSIGIQAGALWRL